VVFYSFIATINTTIFDRYFRARFWSFSYMRNSAVLTAVFLTLILFAQFLFERAPFRLLDSSFIQVAVFIFCLIATIIIDWISLGLTQLLFGISASLNKVSRSIVLIIVDFFVSINIFTIGYSGALAILLIALHLSLANGTAGSASGTVKIAREQIMPGYGSGSGFSDFFPNDPITNFTYIDGISVRVGSSQRGDVDINPIVTYSAPDPIHLIDLTQIAELVFEMKSIPLYLTPEGKNDPEFSGIEYANIYLSHNFGQESYSAAQTVAFNAVEEVQSAFPDSLSLVAEFAPLNETFNRYSLEVLAQQHPLPLNEMIFACRLSQKEGSRWLAEIDANKLPKRCSKRVAMVEAYLFALPMSATNRSLRNYYIPLNSVFMSSFMMTLSLYFLSIMLIIARFVGVKFFGRHSKALIFFERAPFASSSLCVGIVCFALFR